MSTRFITTSSRLSCFYRPSTRFRASRGIFPTKNHSYDTYEWEKNKCSYTISEIYSGVKCRFALSFSCARGCGGEAPAVVTDRLRRKQFLKKLGGWPVCIDLCTEVKIHGNVFFCGFLRFTWTRSNVFCFCLLQVIRKKKKKKTTVFVRYIKFYRPCNSTTNRHTSEYSAYMFKHNRYLITLCNPDDYDDISRKKKTKVKKDNARRHLERRTNSEITFTPTVRWHSSKTFPNEKKYIKKLPLITHVITHVARIYYNNDLEAISIINLPAVLSLPRPVFVDIPDASVDVLPKTKLFVSRGFVFWKKKKHHRAWYEIRTETCASYSTEHINFYAFVPYTNKKSR